MQRVCKEIAELGSAAIAALRKRVDRCVSFDGDIYPEESIPAHLSHLKPGNVYGRFGERIIRLEVRRDGVPSWFDPQTHEGQMGIIPADGPRCYIQLELDHAARNAPSTFESRLLALAEEIPEQTALF